MVDVGGILECTNITQVRVSGMFVLKVWLTMPGSAIVLKSWKRAYSFKSSRKL